jgi:hypothetical protein
VDQETFSGILTQTNKTYPFSLIYLLQSSHPVAHPALLRPHISFSMPLYHSFTLNFSSVKSTLFNIKTKNFYHISTLLSSLICIFWPLTSMFSGLLVLDYASNTCRMFQVVAWEDLREHCLSMSRWNKLVKRE